MPRRDNSLFFTNNKLFIGDILAENWQNYHIYGLCNIQKHSISHSTASGVHAVGDGYYGNTISWLLFSEEF